MPCVVVKLPPHVPLLKVHCDTFVDSYSSWNPIPLANELDKNLRTKNKEKVAELDFCLSDSFFYLILK